MTWFYPIPDISQICAVWPNLSLTGGVDQHKSVLNGPLGPLPHDLVSGLASNQNLSASYGQNTTCFFSSIHKGQYISILSINRHTSMK
jgi:hypothetical protein